MQILGSKTRFAHLTYKQALLVTACSTVFLLSCLASLSGARPFVAKRTEQSDAKMYRRVVNRVQAGGDYYDALGSELRLGGYPMRSVFNWRTPLLLNAIAFLTEPLARILLAVLAVAAIGMASAATGRAGGEGGVQLIVTALALVECFAFPYDFHLFSEVWAGVLVILSITAYAFGWWPLGVVSGILALFVRELVVPYVLVSLAIAFLRQRRAELACWIGGSALWAAYFLVHAHLVRLHMTSSDIGSVDWVQFGGLRFLMATTRMSLLAVLPEWVSAVALAATLLGVAGWTTGIGRRVAAVVVMYMAVFCVVGRPVNFYWGAISNPLLAFGLVWFLPAMRDLARALRRSPEPISEREPPR